MKRKSGVSSVVATVMIIAITIAAVAVLVGIVIPLVSEGPAGEKACYDVMQSLSINEEYTNSSNATNVSVSVSYTGDNETLKGLNLVCFDKTGGSNYVTYNDTEVPKDGGSKVYYCNHSSTIVQVKIYPVVEAKTKEIVCDSPLEVYL